MQRKLPKINYIQNYLNILKILLFNETRTSETKNTEQIETLGIPFTTIQPAHVINKSGFKEWYITPTDCMPNIFRTNKEFE